MSQCLEGLDVLDERGYVLVDKNMETKVKGIYAAGDVLQKDLRQVTTLLGTALLPVKKPINTLLNTKNKKEGMFV